MASKSPIVVNQMKSFQIACQEKKQIFLFQECNINLAGSVNFCKFWVTIAKQEFAGPSANIDVRIPYKLLKNPIWIDT